jgi:hypothetical protein
MSAIFDCKKNDCHAGANQAKNHGLEKKKN